MKKRLILLAALLAATAAPAGAQTLDAFRNKLRSPDATYGSRVEVTEHDTAASAVRTLKSGPAAGSVWGWRVRIFFDNAQNAREKAESTVARFRELYPSIPVQLSYDVPNFKVTVGNCLTDEEAIILKGKVENAFEGAFKVREEIPLSKFGEQPEAAPSPAAPAEEVKP